MEEGLNLLEITDLILFADGGKTPAVESNLFFSLLSIRWKFNEGGLNETSKGRWGRNFCSYRVLVTEETLLPAAQIGKKNGNDEWSHKSFFSLTVRLSFVITFPSLGLILPIILY
jgi:hypothetical protein